MKRLALLLMLAVPSLVQAADDMTIRVDVAKSGPAINPRLYGVFLEEINTAVDGGLYAEMLRNRGFEESKAPEGFTLRNGRWVNPGGYATSFSFQADKDLPYWSVVTGGGAKGVLTLDLAGNLNKETPRAGKLVITDLAEGGRAGIANAGYWGVGAKSGDSYTLNFWVKSDAAYAGQVTVGLEDEAGKPVSEPIKVDTAIDGEWRKVTVKLTATATNPKARLVLAGNANGTLWFDMVSLFPEKTFKDRPNGMRQDIAQMIADLKPGFARFPGGCVVEGATFETAYDWKKTLGPVEQREEAWNVWDYRRTHGMGYFEYLTFIDDIKAEPMFVASAGQMCIFRNETVAVPMDQMQPVADSYLHAIEYANGDATTEWGKKRIEAGRTEPFHMKMLEIGNENVGREYLDRYAFIYPQIKAKYPDVLALACIPHPSTHTEMVDEHYYSAPNWFINNATMYDKRDRKDPPVYIAEVAVTTNEGGRDRGNLQAALAEGVYLMGCERNSDVVQMVSYAPLLANVDGRTPLAGAPPAWHGMIYFDSSRVFGTASYHLWKLFGGNVPSHTVATTTESTNDGAALTGGIGIGTWGTTAEFKDVKIEKKGGEVLFASDFSKPDPKWQTQSGRWALEDGSYRQSRPSNSFARVGDETWTDYTLTLKARKLSGNEGFIIMFGSKGEDRLWWNLGGWGNRQHGIELNQAVIGAQVRGEIETNRWYDIKVEMSGRTVKCYLDGKLIQEATVPVTRTLHSTAGIDKTTGDLVLKVINTAKAPASATFQLTGDEYKSAEATVSLLTSANPTDNNSLDEPLKVAAKSSVAPPLATKPTWEFPASSLTVIRIKK